MSAGAHEPAPPPLREGDLSLRVGAGALSWPGAVLAVLALAMFQVTLLFAYGYLSLQVGGWPPEGVEAPGWGRPALATLLLLASGGAAVALRAAARGRSGQGVQAAALAVLVLGAAFLAVQVPGYAELPVGPAEHAYGSAFVVNVVVQHTFAVAGIFACAVVLQVWGDEPAARVRSAAAALALYWYFVVADWLLVAAVLYGSPVLSGGGA